VYEFQLVVTAGDKGSSSDPFDLNATRRDSHGGTERTPAHAPTRTKKRTRAHQQSTRLHHQLTTDAKPTASVNHLACVANQRDRSSGASLLGGDGIRWGRRVRLLLAECTSWRQREWRRDRHSTGCTLGRRWSAGALLFVRRSAARRPLGQSRAHADRHATAIPCISVCMCKEDCICV
jgi:hypothetical protein